MKKILSLLLAMIMVFSLATVAFADEEGGEPGASEPTAKLPSEFRSEVVKASITIEKLYEVDGNTYVEFPVETLTFSSTPDESNPDDTNLIIADLAVTGAEHQKLDITLPEYSKVGVYKYLIAESTVKEMQAVTYSEAQIAVTVLVTYNYDAEKLDTQVVLSTKASENEYEDGDDLLTEDNKGKVDTFINKYDLGTLTLEKQVSGNLGDTNTYFTIYVTFNSAKEVASDITIEGGSNDANPDTIAKGWTGEKTVTLLLKHGDVLTFTDIPDDVTYSVLEDAKHGVGDDGFDANSAVDTDYTISYEGKSGTIATEHEAIVKNEKKTNVDTGIALDSAPYFVILAVAMFGMVALVSKKRYEV